MKTKNVLEGRVVDFVYLKHDLGASEKVVRVFE